MIFVSEEKKTKKNQKRKLKKIDTALVVVVLFHLMQIYVHIVERSFEGGKKYAIRFF
jgi:hypothetical protein